MALPVAWMRNLFLKNYFRLVDNRSHIEDGQTGWMVHIHTFYRAALRNNWQYGKLETDSIYSEKWKTKFLFKSFSLPPIPVALHPTGTIPAKRNRAHS